MGTELHTPREFGYVDLHSHTNESDGSLSPLELVTLAREVGLDALAITDHDTLTGFEKAREHAAQAGVELICGIELNTRMGREPAYDRRFVHLLSYFFSSGPSEAFSAWLKGEHDSRRNRNQSLVTALQGKGIDITLAEVEARGRTMAGRPHFAKILVEKGYARTVQDAFDRYLGENAPSFVPRHSKGAEEVISVVRSCGGVPVVAHPIRLELPRDQERKLLSRYRDAGLLGLEVFHSEHGPTEQAYYHQLAGELGLMPSGGSDFHGAIKPDVRLGTGRNGNVRVPKSFLDGLRQVAAA